MSEKMARVQGEKAFEVPWDVHVRAWQTYAALGHGDQSAERIHERGGFGALEMVLLLAERDPFRSGYPPISAYDQEKLQALRRLRTESLR